MSIRIRAYNVLFGDCLLVSWDEADRMHHAWVDFGNFHDDRNEVFDIVYADVLKRTGGRLDLVVITHRHLDHMEGFYSLRERFRKDFEIGKLWHAHVTGSLDSLFNVAGRKIRKLIPIATREGSGDVARIFRNNFGMRGITSKRRMDDILATLPCRKKDRHAVHRESKLPAILPPGLDRLKIRILAPEKDSSAYMQPLDHALRADAALRRLLDAGAGSPRYGGGPILLSGGVDARKSRLMKLADFARLYRQLQTGGMELLAAVDRTRNNTSIVLALEYDNRRLLLTGDAEEKSWEVMQSRAQSLAADLIKVAHHGSRNASPEGAFRKVFASRRGGNAAVVSTEPTRFTGRNEVPKKEVLDRWRERLGSAKRLLRTDGRKPGGSVTVAYR